MLKAYTLTITTDGSGDFTDYLASSSTGRVHAIKYNPGTLAAEATLTITGEDSEVPILAKASAGTSDVWFHPRAVASLVDDGSDLPYAAAEVHLYRDRIKLVVSSGGASKTGAVTVYVDEYEL